MDYLQTETKILFCLAKLIISFRKSKFSKCKHTSISVQHTATPYIKRALKFSRLQYETHSIITRNSDTITSVFQTEIVGIEALKHGKYSVLQRIIYIPLWVNLFLIPITQIHYVLIHRIMISQMADCKNAENSIHLL